MTINNESLKSRRIQVSDDFHETQNYCWEQGWTDGLPVVPPTEPLVRRMLAAYGGEPDFSLGIMESKNLRSHWRNWPSTPCWQAVSRSTSQ